MRSKTSKAQPADQPGRPRRPWRSLLALLVGKAVRHVSRLSHHGGSALPGKVVERIDPGFLA